MEKKTRTWTKWLYWFTFAVAVIIIYKTVDNLGQITNWIKNLLNILAPFALGILIAYILYVPCMKIEATYRKVKKVKLSPGDVIVTCTDGLIDSKSLRGEAYGKERIQRSITENTSYMANVMARTIYNSAADFLAKELDDDVSILVIKRLANKN